MIPSLQPTILSVWTVDGREMSFTQALAARRDERGRIVSAIVRVDKDISPK